MIFEHLGIQAENEKELYSIIFQEVERRQSFKEGKKNGSDIIKDAVWSLGLKPYNLIDSRTLDILEKYEYLKYSPHLINNYPFFQSTIILNKLQPRLF